MTVAFSSIPQPRSFLRSVDPRWKLISFFLLVLSVSLLRELICSLLALILAFLLAGLGRLPLRWTLIRLFALMLLLSPFVLSIPFFIPDPQQPQLPFYVPSWPGIRFALLILCKGVTLVTLMLILLTSAPMDHLLKAARALGMPGIIVYLFLMTYRYLFLLIEEFGRLRIALRIRGFRNRANLHSYRVLGRVLGILLIRSHERGERVAQAMRCRGFNGEFRALVEFRTQMRDVVFFLLLIGTSVGLFWWDWLLQHQ